MKRFVVAMRAWVLGLVLACGCARDKPRPAPPAAPEAAAPDAVIADAGASDAAVDAFAVRRLSPASAQWCTALAAANARTLAKHDLDAGCTSPELECAMDDAGAAWGFEVRRARQTLANGGCDAIDDVDPVRADGSARVRLDAGFRLTTAAVDGLVLQRSAAHVQLLGDYDGDGDQEALLVHEWSEHEGTGGAVSEVWTFASGVASRYAPAAGIDVTRAEDVDGDGKLDLVTAGPYAKVTAWAPIGFSYPIGPPIFVEHALADGTFSMTDAVAVAFTRRRCAAAREDAEKIVCDRLRGESEAGALAARKKAGCVDFLEDPARYPESCAKWMPALAAVRPPLRI